MENQTQNETVAGVETIVSSAAKMLVSVVPALGPYGVVIDLGMSLAEKVAPAMYSEIQSLIESIKAGGAPSADQIQKLNLIVSSLKSPDAYFGDGIAAAQKAAAAAAAVSQTAEQAAQAALVGKPSPAPDTVPGFCP